MQIELLLITTEKNLSVTVCVVHAGKVVFQSPAFWQKYAMQPDYHLTEWHSLSDHKS